MAPKITKRVCNLEIRNGKQDIDIAVIKEHCENFKKFIGNDFPHFQDDVKISIENLVNKNDEVKESLSKEISNTKSQISLTLVIGIVSVIILQVILGFFKQ